MDTSNTNFSSLPVELQRGVFTWLPPSSLKNGRLVSKTWARAAAAALFRRSEIDINIGRQHFHAIMEGLSGGFLDNVKNLTFTKSSHENDQSASEIALRNMVELIAALPRDNLLSFASDIRHTSIAIGVLLRTQSRLRELTVCCEPTYPGGLLGPNYVRDNLSELRSLVLHVYGTQCDVLDRLGTWFAHAPLLEKLSVVGTPVCSNSFSGWKLSTDRPLLKLRRLYLRDLTFSDTTASLPGHFCLPSLRCLHIETCSNTPTLLNAFAAAFRSSEDRSLDIFTHRSMTDGHMSTIEFLRTLKAIDHVELTSNIVHNVYPSVSTTFAQIGHTLRFLHIGNAVGMRYKIRTLNELCQVCPNLEVLSLTLASMRQDVDDLDDLQDYQLTAQDVVTVGKTKLMEALRTLAGLCRLRTLRIDNHPLMITQYDTNRCRYRYHQLAASILTYLTKQDSPIKILIFNPAQPHTFTERAADANGHSWPFYAYHTATYTSILNSRECLIAVPIKREDIHLIEHFHASLCGMQRAV